MTKQIKVIILILAFIFIFIIGLNFNNFFNHEPEVTTEYISSKIEKMSELTSAKLTYHGLIKYSEGSVPLITKKAFSMIYCAKVKAGLDLSECEIKIEKDKIIIDIPEMKILDINIDPDSIEFYDEKSALFNWVEKQDIVEAVKLAKKDVEEKGGLEELKQQAKDNTVLIIKALLDNLSDKYEIIIK